MNVLHTILCVIGALLVIGLVFLIFTLMRMAGISDNATTASMKKREQENNIDKK